MSRLKVNWECLLPCLRGFNSLTFPTGIPLNDCTWVLALKINMSPAIRNVENVLVFGQISIKCLTQKYYYAPLIRAYSRSERICVPTPRGITYSRGPLTLGSIRSFQVEVRAVWAELLLSNHRRGQTMSLWRWGSHWTHWTFVKVLHSRRAIHSKASLRLRFKISAFVSFHHVVKKKQPSIKSLKKNSAAHPPGFDLTIEAENRFECGLTDWQLSPPWWLWRRRWFGSGQC